MTKICPICDQPFEKVRNMQKVCSPLCAIEYPNWLKEKKLKQMAKRGKADANLKDKAKQIILAQENFNKFIRLRDHGNPCISCNKVRRSKINSGHYRSVGAHPELRFEELNVHLQCEYCNTHLSANLINYRIHLINKIGIEKVEWLEGPHEPKHYTVDDIIVIKTDYAKLSRDLEKAIELQTHAD